MAMGQAGQHEAVENLLADALRLIETALEQRSVQQSAPQQVLEAFPDQNLYDLAIERFGLVRKEMYYTSGSLAGCLSVSTSDRAPQRIALFRAGLYGLLKRGVKLRMVYHPDALESEDRLSFFRKMIDMGAEIRIGDLGLLGMFVFDRQWAMMGTRPAQPHQQGLLVRSPILVEPLIKLTDLAWRSTSPVDTYLRLMEADFDEIAIPILQYLGAGRKDDLAARELGISVRTYRRYVAKIMRSMRAESRFQAGAKAAALGLISSDC